jgi:hypothetical protein
VAISRFRTDEQQAVSTGTSEAAARYPISDLAATTW